MRAALLAALAVCAAEGTAPSSATVHYVSDHGLVNDTFSTPQEWVIPCAVDNLLSITVFSTPLAYTLELDGRLLDHGVTQGVTCPSSWNMSLLYTPDSTHDNTLEFKWSSGTLAPSVTVHNMPDTASVNDTFSTPQEWVISCTPDSFMLFDAPYTPIGYSLELDGSPLSSVTDQRVTCPSTGSRSLLYTPYGGDSDYLVVTWYSVTPAPSTQIPDTPPPNPVTVHRESVYGLVDDTFSTPQEWLIDCYGETRPLFIDVMSNTSGYNLTMDGSSLDYGPDHPATCPPSQKISLLYTPRDGNSHRLRLSWFVATWEKTQSPDTPSPPRPTMWTDGTVAPPTPITRIPDTPSPLRPTDGTVAPPTPDTPLPPRPTIWDDGTVAPPPPVTRIPDTPSPPRPTIWNDDTVAPPTPNSLIPDTPSPPRPTIWNDTAAPPTPITRIPDTPLPPRPTIWNYGTIMPQAPTQIPDTLSPLTLNTQAPDTQSPPTPTPATVHYLSDDSTVDSSYSTPQEWVISCTPYSFMSVTVTQLPGTLTADTMTLHRGHRGQNTVPCPSTGEVKLSYVPSPDTSQSLIVGWAPESEGDGSQSNSTLLIALIATAGVLVLVCVAVAVYCGCRGQAADPNTYSSNLQVKGYGDVGPTGGFGGLQDISSSPAGQQPVNEMDEQLLAEDGGPLM